MAKVAMQWAKNNVFNEGARLIGYTYEETLSLTPTLQHSQKSVLDGLWI